MKDFSKVSGMTKQAMELIYHAFERGYRNGYEDGKNHTEAVKNMRADLGEIQQFYCSADSKPVYKVEDVWAVINRNFPKESKE